MLILSFTRFQKGMALHLLFSIQGSHRLVPEPPILEHVKVIQKPIFLLSAKTHQFAKSL